MKSQSMEWENIFATDIFEKSLISKIYKESYESMKRLDSLIQK